MGEQSRLSNIQFSHIALLDSLQDIRFFVRNYQQVKPKLLDLQEKMFRHFNLQPADLYTALNEFNVGRREDLKILEFLDVDLKDLKVKTLVFFDQHRADQLDNKPGNFIADFNAFAAAVTARIKAEEKYLIPLIQNFQSNS